MERKMNLVSETVNFLNRGLEEQFKGFRFSIGNEKPSIFSEKDIDEFLDDPNTSADNLPKWLANGIMVTLGAKNIKGKVKNTMLKVLEKIKAGKIKEIIMTPGGKMGKPDAGYSSQTEPKLDPKYFK
jgi:hypothetical protein